MDKGLILAARAKPGGGEDVNLAALRGAAIRAPHEGLTIRREHGEGIEVAFGGDLREARAVKSNREKLEITSVRRVHIRGEDDP